MSQAQNFVSGSKLSCNFWDVEYHSVVSGLKAMLDCGSSVGSSQFRSQRSRRNKAVIASLEKEFCSEGMGMRLSAILSLN